MLPANETSNPAYGKPLHYERVCLQLAEAQEQLRAKTDEPRYVQLQNRIKELIQRRQNGQYTEKQFFIRLKEALDGHFTAVASFKPQHKPILYGTPSKGKTSGLLIDSLVQGKATTTQTLKANINYYVEKQADDTFKPVAHQHTWKDNPF